MGRHKKQETIADLKRALVGDSLARKRQVERLIQLVRDETTAKLLEAKERATS